MSENLNRWPEPPFASDEDRLVRAVAREICRSRSCTGSFCCMYPGNMGEHHKCPVERGGYDDAAKAAIAAVKAGGRETP
jgi:hypothetical protein